MHFEATCRHTSTSTQIHNCSSTYKNKEETTQAFWYIYGVFGRYFIAYSHIETNKKLNADVVYHK
jgi:hypothetical protein